MKDSVKNNSCSFGGDLLGYLYDEIGEIDRDRFELHLADCSACIDDFAELSQSRYPVYEWKKLEFEPLATPKIVIPTDVEKVSLLGKLKAAFAFNPGLSMAGAFSSLLVAFGIGYAMLVSSVPPDDSIAAVKEPSPSASPLRTAAPVPNSANSGTTASTAIPKPAERRSQPDEPKVLPVRAADRKSTKEPVKNSNDKRKKDPALPVMSTIEDEDDSLRLADLFDAIDSSD